ncbi:kinase-like domain-containing protein [Rhizophagus clarus]|uniref:Kinase-like domain-containing protein n=1 Tax=Rhizophagus clarus TaxID=94130 RepID=A0A8H3LLJ4_9GLOM|nr:kinase-like domain-containing protein [Rhizophagus clarus]
MDEGICKECGQKNTGYEWCKECNAKHFQQNFKNWTSGNDDIDNVIQGTQLSAIYNHGVLEWIPYNKFYDIEYIAKGGFGKVFKAKWIDGYIWSWDNKIKNWERMDFNRYVALKSLYNSENVTSEFINEITMHRKTVYTFEYSNVVKVYGITQDPETKDYMMVMEYVENGSLRNYLDKNYDKCLDANPLNQPEIDEIRDVLRKWWCELDDQIELQKQIKEAEEINNKSPSNSIPSTSLSYETHSEAVYTSSLLNFNNLPEPKNSDDYYDKQNDDIIIGNFQDLYKLIFLN